MLSHFTALDAQASHNSLGHSPASIQGTHFDLFAEHIGLHLHEGLVRSHTPIHYYVRYLIELLILYVVP